MEQLDFKSLNFEDTPVTSQQLLPEPLLKESDRRFVLFPIKFNDLWQFYKNIESKFWTAEDIELSDDLEGFQNLSGKARSNIVQLLCCSFQSLYKAQGLTFRFCDEIQVPEARCFFGFQQMQENIHSELFSLILDHITADQDEMRQDSALLVSKLNSVSRREAWTQKYLIESNDSFGERLAAYIVYAHIFDSSIFNMLFHLENGKFMPGLLRATAKVRNDRESFVAFYVQLITHLVNKIPEQSVRKMVNEAVQIESEFIADIKDLALSSLTLGNTVLDFEALQAKCLVSGDQVLKLLGFQPLYQAKDPLLWIEEAYLQERSQFVEHHEIKVVKNTPVKKKDDSVLFSTDVDF